MELYQLRTFTTVADEGHLTRASERLNTSQSAISGHIKALEEELGISLSLRRHPKGMELTDKGKLLKEHAENILQETDNFLLQAKKFKDQVSGIAKIGEGGRFLVASHGEIQIIISCIYVLMPLSNYSVSRNQ